MSEKYVFVKPENTPEYFGDSIPLQKCRFHDDRIAKHRLIKISSNETYFVCNACYDRITKIHSVKKISSRENIIPLQNRKSNDDGKQLFKTSSVAVVQNQWLGRWKDFGKEKKKSEKITNYDYSYSLAFAKMALKKVNDDDRLIFTDKNNQKMMMIEWNNKIFIYTLLGNPLYECDENYNPIVYYPQF